MTPPAAPDLSKHHRFPGEIISHAVWRYFRCPLSHRDVEELLLVRGLMVSYAAIRSMNTERHSLWRAVDQDGNGLDILVPSRRHKYAAKKCFRKLLKGGQYVPRVLITDTLKSYGAAKRAILPGVEHRQQRYLNNRAENSHQPTRQRERGEKAV
jgi:putative transposase